mmetsp:Transcript_104768/g.291773  ORF Transcript_104768/g.291773 Transcript_104768/m.291773 type:complete len:198 (+) Transcript_104768:91-684(+)
MSSACASAMSTAASATQPSSAQVYAGGYKAGWATPAPVVGQTHSGGHRILGGPQVPQYSGLDPAKIRVLGGRLPSKGEWTSEVQLVTVPVTETTKPYVQEMDSAFPYHDVCFGCGWRYHHPDNLDEKVLGLRERKATHLAAMQHAAFVRASEEAWHAAHFRDTLAGVHHRWPPSVRRVQEPDPAFVRAQGSVTEVML